MRWFVDKLREEIMTRQSLEDWWKKSRGKMRKNGCGSFGKLCDHVRCKRGNG